MVVDSLELAFQGFQHCRSSGHADWTLDAAAFALRLAEQVGVLEVEVPQRVVPVAGAGMARSLKAKQPKTRTRLEDLSSEQLRLLALTRAAVSELRELCATSCSRELISTIGYAFHVLPEVARCGGWEAEAFFQFNFRKAAFFWAELPDSMRRLLCQLSDITVEGAKTVINKRGFVIPSRPWSDRLVRFSEMHLVEEWFDPDAN